MEERGRGWRRSGRKERTYHLQKNNTMDVRGGQWDGLKKHQIWPFWTGMEGEAPHRDADYRQKHRQADRRLISDSVNLCSNSWSMIPQ